MLTDRPQQISNWIVLNLWEIFIVLPQWTRSVVPSPLLNISIHTTSIRHYIVPVATILNDTSVPLLNGSTLWKPDYSSYISGSASWRLLYHWIPAFSPHINGSAIHPYVLGEDDPTLRWRETLSQLEFSWLCLWTQQRVMYVAVSVTATILARAIIGNLKSIPVKLKNGIGQRVFPSSK